MLRLESGRDRPEISGDAQSLEEYYDFQSMKHPHLIKLSSPGMLLSF